MRRRSTMAVACLVFLAIGVTAFAADLAIDLSVAPNVLVLGAPTNWITIHTHLLLSSMQTVAVTVNDQPVPIAIVKADSCGLMVLKILETEVDPYVAPGTATFVVTGTTKASQTFAGSDTIAVRQ